MKMMTSLVCIVTALTIIGCAAIGQDAAQTSSAGGTSAGGAIASQVPSTGAAAGMMGDAVEAPQIPAIVDILVQQLGVTPAQASGGAGSIFSMAQQVMTPSNFGLVSKAVPGMDQLLAAVPAAGATNLMGGAAGTLSGSSLGNMAALAGSFQSLGMSPGTMSQFLPVILDYVQNQGGSTAMSLLQGAILP
jgi:Protein of unknown function VcgC/VcgE (DUF2780)